MNAKFIQNGYHNALYKWHGKGIKEIKDPGCPPYYTTSFFNIIKEVAENGSKEVCRMTTKDWYDMLLKKFLTTEVNESGIIVPKKMKAERKFPSADWTRTWSYLRTPGLSGD